MNKWELLDATVVLVVLWIRAHFLASDIRELQRKVEKLEKQNGGKN